MRLALYIDGKAVDLDASSLILYNYTRDEASNPTIVKNSYSQKVTIPATPANNAIFGHYYRNDYHTTAGGFNPIAKTPFEIRNERNEVVESGYIKMESVQSKGAEVVNYSVSLIGGLGGFFYALSYNADGSEKTLADLYYKRSSGGIAPFIVPASDLALRLSATKIYTFWQHLQSEGGYGSIEFDAGHLWNFVPCNNGYPSGNFDADKAIIPTTYADFHNITTTDGDYSAKVIGSGSYVCVKLGGKHTEWELRDLRCYLQRPALSVKGLLGTLTFAENTGGYTFVLDANVFNSTLNWYHLGWLTMPLIDREKHDIATMTFADMLEGMGSPASYLIGFAKMFSLVFLYDPLTKTITLTSRSAYYNDTTPVNIAERIDRESISITPTSISKRWYIYQDTMVKGEFTDAYKEKFEKEYGSAWVDTGYAFNEEQQNLLEKSPFKGAADVQESSAAYAVEAHVHYFFMFDMLEEIKWELYNTAGESKTLSSRRAYNADYLHYYTYGSFANFLSMPQLHGKDNAAQDGANVLLYFAGMKESRDLGSGAHIKFFLTNDDTAAFNALNEGKPCWLAYSQGYTGVTHPYEVVTALPSFRRWHFTAGVMDESMDFGNVQEKQVPETYVPNKGVYHKRWQKYIKDRCNLDTRVLTCKVDLSGMKVDANLLRKFFAFDGAIWSLNKIINHSMTKPALTQCEFIKVQDITNYTTQ